MTVKQCQKKTGTNERMCEAFVRAGLTLDQVTPDYAREWRGFNAKEVNALVKYYISSPEEMPECEPGCVMCHPELYDRSSPDGRKH